MFRSFTLGEDLRVVFGAKPSLLFSLRNANDDPFSERQTHRLWTGG